MRIPLYLSVKVRFYARKAQKTFKEPMLLITNLEVDSDKLGELVWELYMKRSKIDRRGQVLQGKIRLGKF